MESELKNRFHKVFINKKLTEHLFEICIILQSKK